MKKRYFFIVAMIFFVACFQIFAIQVQPIIKSLAQKEIKQYIQLVINHTSFIENIDEDKILNITYKNEQISSLNFNMFYINQMSSNYVNTLEETLINIEEGQFQENNQSIYNKKLKKISKDKGVIAKIGIGDLTNNIFLTDAGPKIKIRYRSATLVSSSIHKSITNYGINHMAVSIDLDVCIALNIIAPLNNQTYQHQFNVPLVFEIIEGEVPSWYQQ